MSERTTEARAAWLLRVQEYRANPTGQAWLDMQGAAARLDRAEFLEDIQAHAVLSLQDLACVIGLEVGESREIEWDGSKWYMRRMQ